MHVFCQSLHFIIFISFLDTISGWFGLKIIFLHELKEMIKNILIMTLIQENGQNKYVLKNCAKLEPKLLALLVV